MASLDREQTAPPRARFTETHWSVVLLAGNRPSPLAQEALETLCSTYWHPVYVYIRSKGHSPADAQDLTQEFFARFLEKNFLAGVDPSKGKFRSFILAAVKHFLANEWDKAKAQKRGGQNTFISLDDCSTNEQYVLEGPCSGPEDAFENRWAVAVLDQALSTLKQEYEAAGKGEQFEALKQFLSSEAGLGVYDSLASRLQMTAGAVAVAVHRLRQRYGECLREQIAHTVQSPSDAAEEVQHLFDVLNR